MSSALNSMSLVALEDIIKKKITLTDSDAAKISKILCEHSLSTFLNRKTSFTFFYELTQK